MDKKNNKKPNTNFMRTAFLVIAVVFGFIWLTSLISGGTGGLAKKLSYNEF
ncbi:MAG: hypothetical protein GF375_00305, partial [Candidatus Omnitrophica bacterium]|nr:hypothetical protein [Candidatus Omnitrophota bacterium]MBD3268607.1 hypothetical protein [Candidatus Omnitrophota bacterium]